MLHLKRLFCITESAMSSAGEVREVYNALQHINLEEKERWSDVRSNVDEWYRHEGQSDEEENLVSYFFMFKYCLLNVFDSQLLHNL